MKRRTIRFDVTVDGITIGVMAKTRGGAARLAFRQLIGPKDSGRPLRNQPDTDSDTGGWKGVSIEP